MMRSFSYAAYAALFAFTVHAPADVALLEPWADTWQRWVRRCVSSGYRSDRRAGEPCSPGEGFDRVLLCAFVLEKAIYELAYEIEQSARLGAHSARRPS